MRSRGDGWRYLQHLPAAYDARHPGALLIVLGSTSIDAKDSHGAGRDAIVLEVPEPHRSVGWTPVDRNERFVRDLLLRAEETLCFDRGDVRLAGSGIGADVARDVVAQLDDERVRYLNIEPR